MVVEKNIETAIGQDEWPGSVTSEVFSSMVTFGQFTVENHWTVMSAAKLKYIINNERSFTKYESNLVENFNL